MLLVLAGRVVVEEAVGRAGWPENGVGVATPGGTLHLLRGGPAAMAEQLDLPAGRARRPPPARVSMRSAGAVGHPKSMKLDVETNNELKTRLVRPLRFWCSRRCKTT
jgi:hypothetical protein